jgi:hypothetical protein
MEQAARLPIAYEFRAVVLRQNDYWITQGPVDLVLALGTVEWTWRSVTFERDAGEVVIGLCQRPEVLQRATAAVRKGQRR